MAEGLTPEDDDYMCQEQYVLELPDELVLMTEDPAFNFDLVFDESGTSGRFISAQVRIEYVFRVFRLPLVTESYTSTDGDVFFKNADISSVILVYDKRKPPQILKDYELLQQINLYKAMRGAFPQGDVGPHGLTPPSRWAPLQLYPQFPVRPKFSKPTPVRPTTISSTEAQNTDKIKQVEQKLRGERQQLEAAEKREREIIDEQRQLLRDGHVANERDLQAVAETIKRHKENIAKLENELRQLTQRQGPEADSAE